MSEPSREDAWALLCEWTESDSLRKHALAVETSMRACARRFVEDEEDYAITGLVHDLDYEKYPDLETGHPRIALAELERLGYDEAIRDAVAGHAPYLGIARESTLAKSLFAVDELSGFVGAVARVRPTGIEGLSVKSVRKKLKQPSFAAKVDREQVAQGIVELGIEEAEVIQLVIDALSAEATALGLAAEQVGTPR